MAIPNVKEARKVALGALVKEWVITCKSCKQPLWKISELQKYGTKWSSKKESYEGIPSYSEYWDKDQKTALKLTCPRCHEPYFEAVQGPQGMAAVFRITDDEGTVL